MKDMVHPFCLAVILTALILGMRCPASAQENDPTGVRQRSYSMRILEREAKRSGIRLPETSADLRQLRKDFERIQVLDRDVIQEAAAGGRLDYGELSSAAAEIRKRCGRLQSSLLPTDSREKRRESGPQDVAGTQDLPAMLTALDGSILSLISNPLFQNTRVIDAEHSERARSDMAKIISLSDKIREEADKLKKTNVAEPTPQR